MAVEFQMPKLGLTMESGRIVEWLVADGANVQQGEAVLVVETDKVDTDIEASGSGILHISANAGETIDCGDCIGWFLAVGESAPVAKVAPSTQPSAPPLDTVASHTPKRQTGTDGTRQFVSPNARRVAASNSIDLSQLVGTGPGGRIVSEDVEAAASSGLAPHSSLIYTDATHAAHQIAQRFGIDVRDVQARGPNPRVDRVDVERYVRERLAEAQSTTIANTAPPEAALLQIPSSTIPLTGMRGTIASRMYESLQAMAQLTLTMDAIMDAVVAHREESDPTTRASYTDYVVAAVATALQDHPVVNSQIAGGSLALLPDINVGLAVALPGGLVVPVIKHTNTLALQTLSEETTRLASAARSGSLLRHEVEGGTFSVTALGAYGVDAFTPVINPPNTAILGVGRLRDEVRWDGDLPMKTKVVTLSLTWDHRAFDGVPAAEFTMAVCERLKTWGSA